MSLGAVTLGALALAVLLSCTSRLNVGLLALALAWVIGVYVGDLPLREVTAGFPVDLFLTLSGVTLLFAQAHVNGTLDVVAHNAIRLCRGRVGVVPIMYFGLGAALASAGPGNIATTGLLAVTFPVMNPSSPGPGVGETGVDVGDSTGAVSVGLGVTVGTVVSQAYVDTICPKTADSAASS